MGYKLKEDGKLSRFIVKHLPLASSWVWRIVPIKIYDFILSFIY